MPNHETLLPLPCPPAQVPAATHLRSTTLVTSIRTLRAIGLGDRYFRELPAGEVGTMQNLVAGTWVPMDVGMTHYATIERLGLSLAQAHENGRRVGEGVQNGYFGTLIRTVGSGVTLWSVLPRFPSLLGRLVRGGAAAVYKEGPKDALIEIHGVPIARFAYVREGWAGMCEVAMELIARKVYVRDVSPHDAGALARLRVSWV